jgi:hypothetical protein
MRTPTPIRINGKAVTVFDCRAEINPLSPLVCFRLLFESSVLNLTIQSPPECLPDRYHGFHALLRQSAIDAVTCPSPNDRNGIGPGEVTFANFPAKTPAAWRKLPAWCKWDELDSKEREIVRQERLLVAMEGKAAPTPQQSEVNQDLLAFVQQAIADELDDMVKTAPSPSRFFLLYCRDRLTLAGMHRKHRWSVRTLKRRKADLEGFLVRKWKLTLESFYVDRRMFSRADRLKARLKEDRGEE